MCLTKKTLTFFTQFSNSAVKEKISLAPTNANEVELLQRHLHVLTRNIHITNSSASGHLATHHTRSFAMYLRLEICVENLQSAVAAEEGGADRIELCQALGTGGLTPSLGLITKVKEMLKIPVFVLIRPRPGNFVYSDIEIQIMIKDMLSTNHIVDGFVTGALSADGKIDKEACFKLIRAANGLPVTFHRAFDLSMNSQSLQDIVNLGFKRILTSGGCRTAHEGMLSIKKLIEEADSRICILPGCGISPLNLREILETTGAVEFHSSGQHKDLYPVVDPNSEIVQGTSFYPSTSADIVRQMKNILKA